jgi:hypothetical protein
MERVMATKPSRRQERGCDRLAEALLGITECARLDGRAAFDGDDLREVGARLGKASSAFGLDQIVARALESRARGLGLRPGTGELLTLMECDVEPLAMLLLGDDDFRSLAESLERELGEVG